MPRLVIISDTHNLHDQMPAIPEGDVLIHAGDLTGRGTLTELDKAAQFLRKQPHAHKILIAGNHDFCLQDNAKEARTLLDGCVYLLDSGVELYGLKFYGSPWQPRFFDWAFNLDRGAELKAVWSQIPTDTDVLITHGPPAGILDRVARGTHVGCADLLDAVNRIKPRIHCFGHIHEAAGTTLGEYTQFINACVCNLNYNPVNPALIIDL